MNSIISQLYYEHYCPKDRDEATDRECLELFDVGFCMGARIMIEVLTSINFL